MTFTSPSGKKTVKHKKNDAEKKEAENIVNLMRKLEMKETGQIEEKPEENEEPGLV